MQHVPAAAWIKDHRFRYTYVNRTYEQVYGRSAVEVHGRDDFDLHAPELARFFRDEYEKIARSSEVAQRLHDVPYADGRPGRWLVVKFPLAGAEANRRRRHRAYVRRPGAERRRGLAEGCTTRRRPVRHRKRNAAASPTG